MIAGFDLSQLKQEDVRINETSLTLTLPKPQVLVTRLDNEETRVYDRQQGLLTRGSEDLESEARLVAEQQIREAACTGGILDEASKNARSQLTALFKTLGFSSVVIETPVGSC